MTTRVVTFFANSSWYLYNFRKNTLSSFLKEGYEVHVMAPDNRFFSLLGELGCHCRLVALSPRSKNPFREFKSLLSIFRGLNNGGKLVFNFTPKVNIYSSLICSFLGINSVNNISGLGRVFNERGLLSLLVINLYWLTNRFTYFTFFQNQDNYEEFVDRRIISKNRASVLPGSGVDLKTFSLHDLPHSKTIRFLYCSRILKPKGVCLLVKACGELFNKGFDIRLTIAGPIDTSDPDCVEMKEIDEWQTRGYVDFVGEVADSRELIKDSDCVVLPSYYAEGTPKILLEAGAMGRVLITTDTSGCRDVVVNDNGFLVQARSLESLTKALTMVSNASKNDLREMGLKSRALIEDQFDEEIVILAYLTKAAELFD